MIFPMYADSAPGVTIWWCDVCLKVTSYRPGPKPEHDCEGPHGR